VEKREIYRSSNGDRWFLARDRETRRVFIRHEANAPSGGQLTDIDIGEFLGGGQRHPEHQALLHLIETLLDSNPDVSKELERRRTQRFHNGPASSLRSRGGRP
jgi:hypothetical protein